ncbi:LpqB family beta-propeller domain-containing protein [Nocardiopsis composta]|uniref:GerMN domain-containing protein n=1 Tax=Nocardiopsis composta TaxID=157465 RepID=A0A7W8QNT6_9ACTN|nr:LpqB family beta-propeller domain-containing protein [Nocardiopsis composta]MBB5432846.1 hypothetical protein [Nocardiopsis composta]
MSVRGGRAAAAGGLAAVLLAAGCATVPSGGPIVEADRVGESPDPYEGYVRMLPVGPQPGVGEEGLVKGFLKDMASFEENHAAARRFLLPQTRAEWSPDDSALVYENMDAVSLDVETSADDTAATVRMRTPEAAMIRADGQYVPVDGSEIIDVTFKLQRDDDGEWRITELPDRLLLSRADVDRVYRPLNLYYFNADSSTLVPDPVFLPVTSDEVATRLAKKLVAGPTEWLEPAVRSSFPADSTADVAFDAGRVVVSMDGENPGNQARFGMEAQLGWTLKQLPEVQEVVLRFGDDEVRIPRDEDENLQTDTDYWKAVNPSGVTGELNAYFVRDGRLWSMNGGGEDTGDQAEQVDASFGTGGPAHYAVSLNEERFAAVSADGGEVLLTESGTGDVRTVLEGGEYTALSWDGYGNLWVAEDTSKGDDPGSRLWMLRGGTEKVRVDAPALKKREVVQLRLSRDGTRAAVVTADGDPEGRLWVGRVVPDGDDGVALGGFLELASEVGAISDAAWRSGDQLAVLGQKNGAMRGYLVPLDGATDPTSVGTITSAETIAAAPERPLIAGGDDDQLWLTSDRVLWQRATEGTDPVFPG